MLIETHAHLDYEEFTADFDGMLQRAAEAGVTRIITIGTSVASSRRAVELAEKYDNIYAVIGVHPTSDATEDDVMTPLREIAQSPRVVAIGETGLDYHRLRWVGNLGRVRCRRSRRRLRWRGTGCRVRLDLVGLNCAASRFRFLSLRLSRHFVDVGRSRGLRCSRVLLPRPCAFGFCGVVVYVQSFCLRCPVSQIDTGPALHLLRILDSDDHFGLLLLHPNHLLIHSISPGIPTARPRMGLWQCERKAVGTPSQTEQPLGVCA